MRRQSKSDWQFHNHDFSSRVIKNEHSSTQKSIMREDQEERKEVQTLISRLVMQTLYSWMFPEIFAEHVDTCPALTDAFLMDVSSWGEFSFKSTSNQRKQGSKQIWTVCIKQLDIGHIVDQLQGLLSHGNVVWVYYIIQDHLIISKSYSFHNTNLLNISMEL